MKIEDVNKSIAKLMLQADKLTGRILKPYEKEMLKQYLVALSEIKKRIAFIYEKFGDDVKFKDLSAYNRLTNLENEIVNQVKNLTKFNIKTTEAAFKEIFSTNFYHTAYALETSVGLKLGFGILNPETIKANILNEFDRIKWPDRMKANAQLYVNQIRTELTQGLIQGKGYAKIAKVITEKTEMSATRSLRIIRTEGHRAQNLSRNISLDKTKSAAERLGLKFSKVWIHSGAPREPRKDHVQMNGVASDEKGTFTLPDGTITPGPGQSGIPEHDINCGCTTGMKLLTLKTKTLDQYLSDELGEVGSFEEWKKKRI